MDVEKTRVSHSFEAFRSYFGVILVCTSLPEYHKRIVQRDVAALALNSGELSTSSVHSVLFRRKALKIGTWFSAEIARNVLNVLSS